MGIDHPAYAELMATVNKLKAEVSKASSPETPQQCTAPKVKAQEACLAICGGAEVARGLNFEEVEEDDDSWDAWMKWQGYDTSEVSAWDDECWEEYSKWRLERAEEVQKAYEEKEESPMEDDVAEDKEEQTVRAEEDASDVLSAQKEHARKKQDACVKGKGEGGCELDEPERPVATPVRAPALKRKNACDNLDAQSSQATVPAEAAYGAGSSSAPGDIVVINSTTHKREYMRLAP